MGAKLIPPTLFLVVSISAKSINVGYKSIDDTMASVTVLGFILPDHLIIKGT